MLGILSGSAALDVSPGTPVAASVAGIEVFGTPSAPVRRTRFPAGDVLMLARHGEGRRLAPHVINYRANIHALHAAGVSAIIGLHTVGGIHAPYDAGALLVPDQLIDYTSGRSSTFSADDAVRHIEFGEPFDAGLRSRLLAAASAHRISLIDGGTYACTQGPRLETAAEINRLERDGCSVVGMTAMPEAALARELGLPYASLCVVVNPAAGRGLIEFAQIVRLGREAAQRMTLLVGACI